MQIHMIKKCKILWTNSHHVFHCDIILIRGLQLLQVLEDTYQLPPYTAFGFKDNKGNLVNKENGIRYIRSDQIIGGFEFNLNENVLFTLEGFGKFYDNYPFSLIDSISLATKGGNYGVVGDEPVLSIGEGKAYGLELSNRTRIGNKLV